MCSERPKVLHEIFDRPVLDYVLETLEEIGIPGPVVVIGNGASEVRAFLDAKAKTSRIRAVTVLQREQKGTGHAVMTARGALAGSSQDVLIWPGDMPFLDASTIREFLRRHRQTRADASVLSALQSEPKGYGRILRAGGRFYGIREELDASETERRIQEINTGVYAFGRERLFGALRSIRPQNRKQEYYLTDVIEILARQGARVEAFPAASPREAHGINSRQHLAEGTLIMNGREIRAHQDNGVTFVCPEQTFVAPGVRIGRDSVIYPWCYIESGVKIGAGCRIGPFAKIRSGTVLGDDCVIGSFVEVNRSKIGNKVLAKHLSYLGDARIGDGTNIGAGTITANYDGKDKHVTRIGKKVFVGSDTVLIAPVSLEDGSRTGAGAVLTRGTRVRRGCVVAGVPARPLSKRR